jgi:uncharacterized membrane protein
LVLAAVLLAVAAIAVGGYRWRFGAGDGSAASDDAGSGDAASAAAPSELLDSEERVLAFVEECGGRVKQAAIADALGWSDARTSQVVGELREQGDVETYRVGRENVVALPDESDI